jgi:hypothetical protein
VIANSSSRGCGFRVNMWGTSSPGDKLTGDLANEPDATSTRRFQTFATKSAKGTGAGGLLDPLAGPA